jgi:hypothetical protein
MINLILDFISEKCSLGSNDECNLDTIEDIQPNVYVYTKECQGKIR